MRCLWIALIVSLASPAAAAIFELDLYASGDALITRDTELDLDWLDVTLTTAPGVSSAVLAGEGGWVDEGWRLATTAEVCSFFGRASGFALNCPGETYENGSWGQPILDLLGITTSREQSSQGVTIFLDQIWSTFSVDGPSGGLGGVELSVDTYSTGSTKTYMRLREDRAQLESLLLVRPIPEPSTGSIFGLGIAALAVFRRTTSRAA